jgi:endoglucanase
VRRSLPIALLALAAAVAVAVTLSSRDDEPRERPASGELPALRTQAGRIVDAEGREVRLRGFNVAPVWREDPGATWGAQHYERMRQGGFNVVRFFLHWSDFEPERGRFDQTHLRTLDTAIARAGDAGLYVVLDVIHLFDGEAFVPAWARTGDALGAVERNARGYLRIIADRYGDERALAAFDPVNEPTTYPPDQNRILRMYDGMIALIRREARDKIVMIEPSFGDSSMRGADLRLLRDKRNVVFSMHDYYAGGAGKGYAANGEQLRAEDGARYAWDGTTGYDEVVPAQLEQHLLVNLEIMRRAGIPVWVGEFGMDPEAPNARQWIRDKVALFDRYRVGYAWWLYGFEDSTAPLQRSPEAFKPFVRDLMPRR